MNKKTEKRVSFKNKILQIIQGPTLKEGVWRRMHKRRTLGTEISCSKLLGKLSTSLRRNDHDSKVSTDTKLFLFSNMDKYGAMNERDVCRLQNV